MDTSLIQLINQTPFLSVGDKGFLTDKLVEMSPLEKLKLERSLISQRPPEILQNLQLARAKFFQAETPKKQDVLTQITNVFAGKKTKEIVARSILTQPNLLGSPVPQAMHNQEVNLLQNLEDLYHPIQLSMLDQRHVNFNLNTNTEQVMQRFLSKLTEIFENIEDVNLKRSYFMNFVESRLFTKYINTALTALRHPELQPAKIILNLLFQINPEYLNSKQFGLAAVISSHLRNICGL
jgi:hypothetical protein